MNIFLQMSEELVTGTTKSRVESLWLTLFFTLCDPAFIEVISKRALTETTFLLECLCEKLNSKMYCNSLIVSIQSFHNCSKGNIEIIAPQSRFLTRWLT